MTSETVVAIYRVRAAELEAFLRVLEGHQPVLQAAGLVSDKPAVVYRGEESAGAPIVFEIFEWIDAAAAEKAHQLPAVMAVWGPLGELCEERGDKPRFEFPSVQLETFGRG